MAHQCVSVGSRRRSISTEAGRPTDAHSRAEDGGALDADSAGDGGNEGRRRISGM